MSHLPTKRMTVEFDVLELLHAAQDTMQCTAMAPRKGYKTTNVYAGTPRQSTKLFNCRARDVPLEERCLQCQTAREIERILQRLYAGLLPENTDILVEDGKVTKGRARVKAAQALNARRTS